MLFVWLCSVCAPFGSLMSGTVAPRPFSFLAGPGSWRAMTLSPDLSRLVLHNTTSDQVFDLNLNHFFGLWESGRESGPENCLAREPSSSQGSPFSANRSAADFVPHQASVGHCSSLGLPARRTVQQMCQDAKSGLIESSAYPRGFGLHTTGNPVALVAKEILRSIYLERRWNDRISAKMDDNELVIGQSGGLEPVYGMPNAIGREGFADIVFRNSDECSWCRLFGPISDSAATFFDKTPLMAPRFDDDDFSDTENGELRQVESDAEQRLFCVDSALSDSVTRDVEIIDRDLANASTWSPRWTWTLSLELGHAQQADPGGANGPHRMPLSASWCSTHQNGSLMNKTLSGFSVKDVDDHSKQAFIRTLPFDRQAEMGYGKSDRGYYSTNPSGFDHRTNPSELFMEPYSAIEGDKNAVCAVQELLTSMSRAHPALHHLPSEDVRLDVVRVENEPILQLVCTNYPKSGGEDNHSTTGLPETQQDAPRCFFMKRLEDGLWNPSTAEQSGAWIDTSADASQHSPSRASGKRGRRIKNGLIGTKRAERPAALNLTHIVSNSTRGFIKMKRKHTQQWLTNNTIVVEMLYQACVRATIAPNGEEIYEEDYAPDHLVSSGMSSDFADRLSLTVPVVCMIRTKTEQLQKRLRRRVYLAADPCMSLRYPQSGGVCYGWLSNNTNLQVYISDRMCYRYLFVRSQAAGSFCFISNHHVLSLLLDFTPTQLLCNTLTFDSLLGASRLCWMNGVPISELTFLRLYLSLKNRWLSQITASLEDIGPAREIAAHDLVMRFIRNGCSMEGIDCLVHLTRAGGDSSRGVKGDMVDRSQPITKMQLKKKGRIVLRSSAMTRVTSFVPGYATHESDIPLQQTGRTGQASFVLQPRLLATVSPAQISIIASDKSFASRLLWIALHNVTRLIGQRVVLLQRSHRACKSLTNLLTPTNELCGSFGDPIGELINLDDDLHYLRGGQHTLRMSCRHPSDWFLKVHVPPHLPSSPTAAEISADNVLQRHSHRTKQQLTPILRKSFQGEDRISSTTQIRSMGTASYTIGAQKGHKPSEATVAPSPMWPSGTRCEMVVREALLTGRLSTAIVWLYRELTLPPPRAPSEIERQALSVGSNATETADLLLHLNLRSPEELLKHIGGRMAYQLMCNQQIEFQFVAIHMLRQMGVNVNRYLKSVAFHTSRRLVRHRLVQHLAHMNSLSVSEIKLIDFMTVCENLYCNPCFTAQYNSDWTTQLTGQVAPLDYLFASTLVEVNHVNQGTEGTGIRRNDQHDDMETTRQRWDSDMTQIVETQSRLKRIKGVTNTAGKLPASRILVSQHSSDAIAAWSQLTCGDVEDFSPSPLLGVEAFTHHNLNSTRAQPQTAGRPWEFYEDAHVTSAASLAGEFASYLEGATPMTKAPVSMNSALKGINRAVCLICRRSALEETQLGSVSAPQPLSTTFAATPTSIWEAFSQFRRSSQAKAGKYTTPAGKRGGRNSWSATVKSVGQPDVRTKSEDVESNLSPSLPTLRSALVGCGYLHLTTSWVAQWDPSSTLRVLIERAGFLLFDKLQSIERRKHQEFSDHSRDERELRPTESLTTTAIHSLSKNRVDIDTYTSYIDFLVAHHDWRGVSEWIKRLPLDGCKVDAYGRLVSAGQQIGKRSPMLPHLVSHINDSVLPRCSSFLREMLAQELAKLGIFCECDLGCFYRLLTRLAKCEVLLTNTTKEQRAHRLLLNQPPWSHQFQDRSASNLPLAQRLCNDCGHDVNEGCAPSLIEGKWCSHQKMRVSPHSHAIPSPFNFSELLPFRCSAPFHCFIVNLCISQCLPTFLAAYLQRYELGLTFSELRSLNCLKRSPQRASACDHCEYSSTRKEPEESVEGGVAVNTVTPSASFDQWAPITLIGRLGNPALFTVSLQQAAVLWDTETALRSSSPSFKRWGVKTGTTQLTHSQEATCSSKNWLTDSDGIHFVSLATLASVNPVMFLATLMFAPAKSVTDLFSTKESNTDGCVVPWEVDVNIFKRIVEDYPEVYEAYKGIWDDTPTISASGKVARGDCFEGALFEVVEKQRERRRSNMQSPPPYLNGVEYDSFSPQEEKILLSGRDAVCDAGPLMGMDIPTYRCDVSLLGLLVSSVNFSDVEAVLKPLWLFTHTQGESARQADQSQRVPIGCAAQRRWTFPSILNETSVNGDDKQQSKAAGVQATPSEGTALSYNTTQPFEDCLAIPYYIAQGRPLMAIYSLIAQGRLEEFVTHDNGDWSTFPRRITLTEEDGEKLQKTALNVALHNLLFEGTLAAAVCFLEMCGLNTELFRVDTRSAQRIYEYGDYLSEGLTPGGGSNSMVNRSRQSRNKKERLSLSTVIDLFLKFPPVHRNRFPGYGRDMDEDENNSSRATSSPELLRALRMLEEATRSRDPNFSFTLTPSSAPVTYDNPWHLVALFCRVHQLPPSLTLLHELARNGDWVMFLHESDLQDCPVDTALDVIKGYFTDKPLQTHLHIVVSKIQQTAMGNTGRRLGISPHTVGGQQQTGSIETVPSERARRESEAVLSRESDHTDGLLFLFSCRSAEARQEFGGNGHRSLREAVATSTVRLAVYASCFNDVTSAQCMATWLLLQTKQLKSVSMQASESVGRNESLDNSDSHEEDTLEAICRSAFDISPDEFVYSRGSPVIQFLSSYDSRHSRKVRGYINHPEGSAAGQKGKGFKQTERRLGQRQVPNKTRPRHGGAHSRLIHVPPKSITLEWLSSSEGLSTLISALCQSSEFALVLRALHLFDPNSVLIPFVLFYQAFMQRRFIACESHLTAFVRQVGPTSDAKSERVPSPATACRPALLYVTELTNNTIDHLIFNDPLHRRQLLRILDKASYSPRHSLLHLALTIIDRQGLSISITHLLPYTTQLFQSLLNELLRKELFEDALLWATHAGLDRDEVIFHQVTMMLVKFREGPFWLISEEFIGVIEGCYTLMKNSSTSNEKTSRFFLEVACILEGVLLAREQAALLAMALEAQVASGNQGHTLCSAIQQRILILLCGLSHSATEALVVATNGDDLPFAVSTALNNYIDVKLLLAHIPETAPAIPYSARGNGRPTAGSHRIAGVDDQLLHDIELAAGKSHFYETLREVERQQGVSNLTRTTGVSSRTIKPQQQNSKKDDTHQHHLVESAMQPHSADEVSSDVMSQLLQAAIANLLDCGQLMSAKRLCETFLADSTDGRHDPLSLILEFATAMVKVARDGTESVDLDKLASHRVNVFAKTGPDTDVELPQLHLLSPQELLAWLSDALMSQTQRSSSVSQMNASRPGPSIMNGSEPITPRADHVSPPRSPIERLKGFTTKIQIVYQLACSVKMDFVEALYGKPDAIVSQMLTKVVFEASASEGVRSLRPSHNAADGIKLCKGFLSVRLGPNPDKNQLTALAASLTGTFIDCRCPSTISHTQKKGAHFDGPEWESDVGQRWEELDRKFLDDFITVCPEPQYVANCAKSSLDGFVASSPSKCPVMIDRYEAEVDLILLLIKASVIACCTSMLIEAQEVFIKPRAHAYVKGRFIRPVIRLIIAAQSAGMDECAEYLVELILKRGYQSTLVDAVTDVVTRMSGMEVDSVKNGKVATMYAPDVTATGLESSLCDRWSWGDTLGVWFAKCLMKFCQIEEMSNVTQFHQRVGLTDLLGEYLFHQSRSYLELLSQKVCSIFCEDGEDHLMMSMQMFLECSKQFLENERFQMHLVCNRWAALIGLQLKSVQLHLNSRSPDAFSESPTVGGKTYPWPNPSADEMSTILHSSDDQDGYDWLTSNPRNAFVVINLSLDQLTAFLSTHGDFLASLTVAQAYEHIYSSAVHDSWGDALFQQVVRKGNQGYMNQFLSVFQHVDQFTLDRLVAIFCSIMGNRSPKVGHAGIAIKNVADVSQRKRMTDNMKMLLTEGLKDKATLLAVSIERQDLSDLLRCQVAERLGEGFDDLIHHCKIVLNWSTLYRPVFLVTPSMFEGG
eukprot:GHVN01035255.1.p1 GENE.GHVN01035255.1~~GHVN01035255.1.p1  ORF type:complete len:3937 (-),score=369.45 GHVN01035255.1:575-12385(-)